MHVMKLCEHVSEAIRSSCCTESYPGAYALDLEARHRLEHWDQGMVMLLTLQLQNVYVCMCWLASD